MGNKIFIGGLNYAIDEDQLREIFSQFGKIINLRIVRNPETRESKGFGFITFAEESEAQKALAMDGVNLEGRLIGVAIAHKPNRK